MVHLPIPQQVSALSQQGADAQGGTVREGAPRGKEESAIVPSTVPPNHYWKASHYHETIATSSPKDPRRDSNGTNNRSQQVVGRVERKERAELFRETERGESELNYSEMNIQRATVAPGETRSEMEMQKQHVNIRETLSSLDQRKERKRVVTGDSAREISIEDVRHDATKTEEDSIYPRVTRQMSERVNGKIVWRASGTVASPQLGAPGRGARGHLY
ncbi:uncharacterized protein MONOS_5588 [Monocercomonoides exilis]|uniref:uncharacterized protein n=1 Tax=Monocercomonoides exilis TaxID=2049356 RepID=UPI00355A62C3|nr:hypothetical protein MONOS_5588 [Monocercomonoides exilis]|eukprot:MONOS_5588.1-p1 / transcript=MONOS_5588.1 / gene=MONOS_5588 / organism=Monocercomonoides_exilis_PA203 / gene_product=unspecified product / transcript_product=unspecified product / location=Mono_scaffold00164:88555-89263(+) / protein_length=217 / sequence_SO=supercontig / SO=protein_coding / is_pseudo=false